MRPRLRLLVGVLEAKGLPNVPRLRLGVSPLPNACVQLWLEPLALRDSTRQTSRVVWRSAAPRYGQSFTFRPVLTTAGGGGVLRVGVFDSLSPLVPTGSVAKIGRKSDKAGGGVVGGPVSGAPPTAQATIANATVPLRELMAVLLADRGAQSGDGTKRPPLGIDIWLPLVKGAAEADGAVSPPPTAGVAGALRRSLRGVVTGSGTAIAAGPCPDGSGGSVRLYISAVFDDTIVGAANDAATEKIAAVGAVSARTRAGFAPKRRTVVSPKKDLGEVRQPFAGTQAAKRRTASTAAPKKPAQLFGSATVASALARARATRGGTTTHPAGARTAGPSWH